ncbi:hypothetical protein Tco_1270357 [Tanacetum coccineum]
MGVKVHCVEESKNLTTLSLDELIGNLKESSDDDRSTYRLVKKNTLRPGVRRHEEILLKDRGTIRSQPQKKKIIPRGKEDKQ